MLVFFCTGDVDGYWTCNASKPANRTTINSVERLTGNRSCTGRPIHPGRPCRLVTRRAGVDVDVLIVLVGSSPESSPEPSPEPSVTLESSVMAPPLWRYRRSEAR